MTFQSSRTSVPNADLVGMIELRRGPWNLTDLKQIPKNGLKVFSCFHCGGGSSMGYKLAGFDVLGGVEIDREMMNLYRVNHNPRHSYLSDIREFNDIPNSELPDELFDLDILDGSPPCSSFSTTGVRERDWGKGKKFTEGQTKQVLDDLFFSYIETVQKLQPKVVIAENVVGLIQGKARGYVREILRGLDFLGYTTQIFKLNAAFMGVPQQRPRIFFISNKEGKSINMRFDEDPISLSQAFEGCSKNGRPLTDRGATFWRSAAYGENLSMSKSNHTSHRKLHPHKPAWTLKSTGDMYHWSEPRKLSRDEATRMQTFPDDYNYMGANPVYVCGMSVPPFMMQRIALSVREQLFD